MHWATCPSRFLPPNMVPHAVSLIWSRALVLLKSACSPHWPWQRESQAFFMFFLSETKCCSWCLCGITCHWQGSCEVNDSANKKLLVIRRLDVQALLLFLKKSISWIRKCHWDKHLFFSLAQLQLGGRIMWSIPEGESMVLIYWKLIYVFRAS